MDNAPWSLHHGLVYAECLDLLAKVAADYQGEAIPQETGVGEHPLHRAVRLVESFQPVNAAGWRRLPGRGSEYWGEVLRACREGMMEFRSRKRDWGQADPERARIWARKLAEWAKARRRWN